MQFVRFMVAFVVLAFLLPVFVMYVVVPMTMGTLSLMPALVHDVGPRILAFAKSNPLAVGAAVLLFVFYRLIWKTRKDGFDSDEW